MLRIAGLNNDEGIICVFTQHTYIHTYKWFITRTMSNKMVESEARAVAYYQHIIAYYQEWLCSNQQLQQHTTDLCRSLALCWLLYLGSERRQQQGGECTSLLGPGEPYTPNSEKDTSCLGPAEPLCPPSRANVLTAKKEESPRDGPPPSLARALLLDTPLT